MLDGLEIKPGLQYNIVRRSTKTTSGPRLLLEVKRNGMEEDDVYVQPMTIGSGEGDAVKVPEVGPGFAVVRGDNAAYVVRVIDPTGIRIFDERTGHEVCELVLAAGVVFRIGNSRFQCVAVTAAPTFSGGGTAELDWTTSCPLCNQPMDWEEEGPCRFCGHTSRTLNEGEGRWRGRVPGRLGAFAVDTWVACGGMGMVFRGKGDDDKFVALKLIRSRHPDSTALGRFEEEMRLASGIPPHPNLVHQIGQGVEELLPWLAMEWVEGETLADRLRIEKGTMAIREIESIMRQLLAGLRHLHAHRIVHRDLKPSNIFIKPDHGVKIGDFGVARSLNAATQATLTLTGSVVGTMLYMSPEQHDGRSPTLASDIYALGLIWQEMLTGAHTGGLIVVNRQDCPMAWKRTIHRMLCLDPHSRPSLDEIELRLGQLFRGRWDYLLDRWKRFSKWAIPIENLDWEYVRSMARTALERCGGWISHGWDWVISLGPATHKLLAWTLVVSLVFGFLYHCSSESGWVPGPGSCMCAIGFRTGTAFGSGTDGQVTLIVVNQRGKRKKLHFDGSGDVFENGEYNPFSGYIWSVDTIDHIEVKLEPKGYMPAWKLESITITEQESRKVARFNGSWLGWDQTNPNPPTAWEVTLYPQK